MTPFDAITPPDRGPFLRRIALTFDDGPDPSTTPRVLDVLARRGLKATFFVHGARVPGNESLLRRALDEGHQVGNHAERHQNLSDPAALSASLASTAARLEPILPADQPRWFRFPGGNASLGARQAVEAAGHCVTGWHVDSADWCFDDPRGGRGTCHPDTFRWVDDDVRDDLPENVLRQARRFEGGIALFHDNRRYTAETLDEIITALAFAGFGFTTLLDDQVFPQLVARARQLRAPRLA